LPSLTLLCIDIFLGCLCDPLERIHHVFESFKYAIESLKQKIEHLKLLFVHYQVWITQTRNTTKIPIQAISDHDARRGIFLPQFLIQVRMVV